MKKLFILFFLTQVAFSQTQNPVNKKTVIKIVYGGNLKVNEDKYPGAKIFSKTKTGQVRFEHEGMDLWCDRAVLFQDTNWVKAYGNVFIQQGDSVEMSSEYIEYDGDTKRAISKRNVRLKNTDMTLSTDTLYFDRNKQEAYFNTGGIVKDSATVLKSIEGRYFMEKNKYQFLKEVNITNPEYTVNSAQLDYYTDSKHAYMYGPSTIKGDEYTIYCERGFYNTVTEKGYFIKKSRIDYDNRIINGDSLYFEKNNEFASATNNIKITDTINKMILKGHYGEVYKAKDSAFITKRAVAISLVETDSMYIHGDRLLVTGPAENRVIRAYKNVKFFKTDMSGKCDSLFADNKSGITKMLNNPILWNGESQMTGDTIFLISNVKTEKLDSLKVINNAFIVNKDTLGEGYNQVKGLNLYGKFEENKLREVDVVKNTEVVYYMYNDENEFIGINKTICSAINLTLNESQIEDITFFTRPDGVIYPDKDLPKNARKLRGFVWRGDERMFSKEDIFDEDDNNLVLPVIRGVNNAMDPLEEKRDSDEKALKPTVKAVPPEKKKEKVYEKKKLVAQPKVKKE
ncbi:LPS-assembly protein LptD [Kordia antarctica]|uniref:LPS-assembly protein LptD n=1 Tax=Kordia antarctica TaxID=1218801 RepID=A0A7L4ZQH7_9FLAO|nr:OstA-like protein [Kordia antarctica]QHI38993.1 LPS-assembly protein LptD [Kordia antarctica]